MRSIVKTIAAYACSIGARGQIDHINARWYHSRVSSKKGLIRVRSLSNRCDASRSSPADRAAYLFASPFMAARMGSLTARRFAQAVPGLRTRSSCRPHFEVGAAVFANRTAWRPNMAQSLSMGATAQILTHARFDRVPVVQTRRRGRFPNSVINFWKAGGEIRFVRRLAHERQEEIAQYRAALAATVRAEHYMRHKIAQLSQQTKGAANV